MTDYQFNMIISVLIDISRELRHVHEDLQEHNKRNAKPAPPVDPIGYTE